ADHIEERDKRKDEEGGVVMAAVAAVVVAAAAARQWRRRKERQWKKTERILRKFARECATPVSKLWEVATALMVDMQASLSSENTTTSSLNMLVSYVSSLPTGEEKGLFYGLNLRGNDFLIICARLGGNNEPISEMRREEVSLSDHEMLGSSQDLFDCIAKELAKFISMHPDSNKDTASNEDKKLGLTLLYPANGSTSTSGSAIKWKSLSADDTIGKQLLDDINQALEKHGVHMKVYGLVDNTVGDLAGGRYYDKDSIAAVTLGMSTNAAYMEQAQAVPRWNGSSAKSGEIAISTEWGSFNSCHLPITEFDASLDAESSNPGNRIFEKLISGTFLGEIVRRVLLKMAVESALFGESVPPKLRIPYILRSPDMAAMHQDTSEDREILDVKLREIFGIKNSSVMVREVVAEVCDIVAERGARLAGAGIVGMLKKLGRIESKRSVVMVEGGLYEHYRLFRNYLHSSVWEMLGNQLSDNVLIQHSHGGSGAGAIFLAASQTQQHS
ncbi:probable hexokinase-like 2 protein, partial [Carica papaya]|uniref:probable hexokinase-like 2 protein n=1 Tax=Carica papaya TaxID=3649 RepID=UPI000B8CAFF5